MSKNVTALLVSLFTLFTTASPSLAGPLAGCVRVSAPSNAPGRFIWKPTGAHFPGNAVIVTPRYYSPVPPKVALLSGDGNTLFEYAKLKSKGDCGSNKECLFAATFLTRLNGGSYRRGYGQIIVRLTQRSEDTGPAKQCRYYVISNPGNRAEFAG